MTFCKFPLTLCLSFPSLKQAYGVYCENTIRWWMRSNSEQLLVMEAPAQSQGRVSAERPMSRGHWARNATRCGAAEGGKAWGSSQLYLLSRPAHSSTLLIKICQLMSSGIPLSKGQQQPKQTYQKFKEVQSLGKSSFFP